MSTTIILLSRELNGLPQFFPSVLSTAALTARSEFNPLARRRTPQMFSLRPFHKELASRHHLQDQYVLSFCMSFAVWGYSTTSRLFRSYRVNLGIPYIMDEGRSTDFLLSLYTPIIQSFSDSINDILRHLCDYDSLYRQIMFKWKCIVLNRQSVLENNVSLSFFFSENLE